MQISQRSRAEQSREPDSGDGHGGARFAVVPLPVLTSHFPDQLISKEAWPCPCELTARLLHLDRRGPVAELPSEPDLELAPLIESGSSYWGHHE